MNRTLPPFHLPDDVLSVEGQRFFDLVSQTCGCIFKEFMEILSIDPVYKLLLIKIDILSMLQKNYRELKLIKQRACLHLDDRTTILKPGLKFDFDRFIEALRVTNNQNEHSTQLMKFFLC